MCHLWVAVAVDEEAYRGGAQEEVIWKELEEASMALEEVMNNRKHVCAARAWTLVIYKFFLLDMYMCVVHNVLEHKMCTTLIND